MNRKVSILILTGLFLIALLGCPVVNESVMPAAPDTISATAISSIEIGLAWTDNSNNEDGFKIERSPGGISFTPIDTVSADVTSYSDTGLSAGTEYWYRVRAYNTTGDSGYTNTANATTNIPTEIELTITVNTPLDETISFNGADDIVAGPLDTLIVSINAEFVFCEWYLNGLDLSSYTSNSVDIDCSSLSLGVHHLTVFVEKNSLLYSKTLRFRIEN